MAALTRILRRRPVVPMPSEGYAPAVSTVLLPVAVARTDLAHLR
jgi:hypothetical protein